MTDTEKYAFKAFEMAFPLALKDRSGQTTPEIVADFCWDYAEAMAKRGEAGIK